MKKLTKGLLLLLLLQASLCLANVNTQVRTLEANAVKTVTMQHGAVKQFATVSSLNSAKNVALVNHFLHLGRHSLHSAQPHGGKAANGAMLMVSLSMPEALLMQMGAQAARYHIPLLLRGLVDNSMPKTLKAILHLKLQAKKQHRVFNGIGIDPVWFTQFGIDRVPALVVTKRPLGCVAEKNCPGQPFDVIYGNQSIHDSLVQIAREGSAPIRPIATQLLHRFGDTQ